ncbi:TetR family transcriptional regulator C-terminal domain-containing protein [Agaribacter flavus]|uniref:TetR family transcriptional regulator C-terminal domain-containing protein n=1 Tax=Agaribacter flavus TaxID=1902781 RepID=A0ABV7FMI8_9ALTE
MTIKAALDGRIGAKNKATIVKAAERAFAKHGFKGTSVQQIADAAGLPKTNVLYYFKSKQGLYLAVLQQIMAIWNLSFDKATANDDPAETLAEYISEKMEVSRTRPYASKVFAMEIINGATNFQGSFLEEHREWMNGRTAVIDAWVAQGKMPPIDAHYLLYHIWASTQHYADFSTQISNLRGSTMKKADYKIATLNLVNMILQGCGLQVPKEYQLLK